MSDRPLSLVDLAALKGATKDLVKAVGGCEAAAAIVGRSSSLVRQWYAAVEEKDPSRPSWWTIDLVSIALLEKDLEERGDPRRPVTAALARLSGRRIDDGIAARARDGVAVAAAKVTAALGDLSADVMATLADGVVTVSEAERGDVKAARVAEALGDLRAAFNEVRGGEGGR